MKMEKLGSEVVEQSCDDDFDNDGDGDVDCADSNVPSALQKIVRQLVTKMAMVWQIVLMAVPSLLMHLKHWIL